MLVLILERLVVVMSAYADGNFKEIQLFVVLDSNSCEPSTAPFRIQIPRLTPGRALT
jgi:hypothetical protein